MEKRGPCNRRETTGHVVVVIKIVRELRIYCIDEAIPYELWEFKILQ